MDSITHILKTLDEVGEILPHISNKDLYDRHLKNWIIDNKFSRMDAYCTPKYNPFIENLFKTCNSTHADIKFIMILGDNSAFTKRIVDEYTRMVRRGITDRIPQQIPASEVVNWIRSFDVDGRYGVERAGSTYKVVKNEKTISRNNSLKKLSNTSGYIFEDDSNYSALKEFTRLGLHENIIHVEICNKYDTFGNKPKNDILDAYLGNSDVKLETTSLHETKLTKVMKSFLDDNESKTSEWWKRRAELIKNGKSVRVNFRLKNTGADVERFLFKQYSESGVLPLRFNWNGYGNNRHIIGGSVICEFGKHDKFINRLKLFNSTNISVFCKYDTIKTLVVEKYESNK